MTLEFLGGNKLQLLVNGSAYFPALERAFDAAQSEIYLETYIFADDDTGRRIAAALLRAAARGVKVHVLVDGFGSKGIFEQTRQLLSAANIEVLIFGPKTSPLTLRRNRLRRLHRKLVAELGLKEVFRDHRGRPARTYPSTFPLLRLDRIYARGFDVRHAEVHHGLPWSRISDHAALSVELELR
jgi:hypothetical protein